MSIVTLPFTSVRYTSAPGHFEAHERVLSWVAVVIISDGHDGNLRVERA